MKKKILIISVGIIAIALITIGLFTFGGTTKVTAQDSNTFSITQNSKIYNEENQSVNIFDAENNLLANLQLLTPIENKVRSGYQVIAEIEINNAQDSSLLYDQMKFYNIKDSMKEINKTFDFMFKENISVSVDDYGLVNISLGKYKKTTNTYDYPTNQTNGTKIDLINYFDDLNNLMCQEAVGTGELFGCDYILGDKSVWKEEMGITGSHMGEEEQWKLFDKLKDKENILAGSYTVGIFTNNTDGEYYEWIPTFFGVEIEEWASVLVTDLTAYYKLDEGSGNAVDEQGNFTSTANSATQGVSGIINTAYDYDDGSAERTDFAHIIDTATANAFSITGWINPNDLTGADKILGQDTSGGRGFQIYIDGVTNQLGFYNGIATVYINTGVTISAGNWYFFAITYDGAGTMNMTTNGVTQTKTSVTFVTDTTHTFHLGFDGRNAYGDMVIDEVYISSRELTPDEVSELYGGGSPPSYPFEPEDTCTYSSGNWEVNCADNCSITDNVDVGGNNISIIGTGAFTTTANITNFEEILIAGNSSSLLCEVTCHSGGCFQ